MDNHFSGDVVANHIGEKGYKCINTCRRYQLPLGTASRDFHYKKDVKVCYRSKVARFEQPIVAVKYVHHPAESEKESYCIVHVSFQSTGDTNIQSVNVLSELQLYVRERTKGRGDSKRKWGIEMNEAWELYLKCYGAIDKIDQIKGLDY